MDSCIRSGVGRGFGIFGVFVAVSQPKRNFNTVRSAKDLTSESSISRYAGPFDTSGGTECSGNLTEGPCLQVAVLLLVPVDAAS